MGCFTRCFKNPRKQRPAVQAREQTAASQNPVQSRIHLVPLVRESPEKLITPVAEIPEKLEEDLSSSTRKKVTFDTNVKTYEHVLPDESIDFSLDNEENNEKKEKSSRSPCSGSYPPNHRYQNCRESDDEVDELEDEESDLDDDGLSDVEDDDIDEDIDSRIHGIKDVYSEKVEDSSTLMGASQEKEGLSSMGLNRTVRDRSGYVHSVLNPVENISQWKVVKAKGASRLTNPRHKNFSMDQENCDSFHGDTSFEELSFSFKSKSNQQQKESNQVLPVNASLSSWLSSSETTPIKKNTAADLLDANNPEKNMSPGSNSMISHEERPILGALTLDEIKQFSASTPSPRRSPCRSPDDMPIIGTVGTYWSPTGIATDSRSASSFKGIPNTTSKYTEDKRVNWHSTPFVTRLEKALNSSSAAETHSTHSPSVC